MDCYPRRCFFFFFFFRPSGRSANVILPSYLKRKRQSGDVPSSSKRCKAIQCWDRDIVCLPQSSEPSTKLSYPRGKYRTRLGELGLIGKIRLMSNMTVDEVEQEIRSVFKGPMGGKRDFLFDFLQPTGTGTRTLTVPSVSSSFSWTAQQVAKLGGNKQAIYILARDELVLPQDSEVHQACMNACQPL